MSDETLSYNAPNDDELDEVVDDLIESIKQQAKWEAERDVNKNYGPNPHTRLISDEDVEDEPTTDEKVEEWSKKIRERYEDLKTPHPRELDDLITKMQEVHAAMGSFAPTKNLGDNPDLDEIGEADFSLIDTAKGDIQKWNGDLRDNLVENFMTPLHPNIIGTQGNLARHLHETARMMQMVYERRRTDAKKLAEQAKTAMDAVDDGGSSGANALVTLFAVIGGLSGFAGAFAAAGSGLAFTAALSGSSAGVASTIGGKFVKDDKEIPLGADRVDGVIKKLYEALDKSDETMKDEEDAINSMLKNLAALLEPMINDGDGRKGSIMVPMRPDISVASNKERKKEFTIWDRDA